MKVHVSNKSQETIKFRVTLRPLETPCNVILPESFMTDTLYQNEYKCIGNFQKIDPSKPWTQVKVELEAVKKTYGQASGFSNGSAASGTDGKIFKALLVQASRSMYMTRITYRYLTQER